MDSSRRRPTRRASFIVLLVVGTLLALLGVPTVLARPLEGPGTTPSGNPCSGVTDVPQSECESLVALYEATDGPNWTTNTNWLVVSPTVSPCDWYGVVCAGGHVTELRLGQNGLQGSIPGTLQFLPHLTHLFLDNNRLRGTVPPGLCELTDTVVQADLAYNALTTFRFRVRDCLATLDPDWIDTQTVAPRTLTITAITTDSLELGWSPIPYADDGGFYEVSYATEAGGPYTVHGQTSDKLATSYRLDGLEAGRTYFVRVRTFTPAHDAQPDDLWSLDSSIVGVTKGTGGRMLFAVYFAADNDLSSYIGPIGERLRLGTSLNPNVQVLFLADGRGEANTIVLDIAGGVVTPTTAVRDAWGTDELDTGDPQVLTWFLRHAREHYPTERTFVSLIGHGVALAPEITWSDRDSASFGGSGGQIPPLPQTIDYTPSDVTNRGYMSTIDLGRALRDATDDGATPFDLVFFDQCFQGSLDTLYEVHQAAEIFVASPNYAWLAAPYAQYLVQMAPAAPTEAIADSIIRRYEVMLDNSHPNAIFWLRGTDVATIAAAVSELGARLRDVVESGTPAQANAVHLAAQNSLYVDTTQCGRQQLSLGPPDELMGAGSFASHLQSAPDLPLPVRAAAGDLLATLGGVHKLARTGNPYIAPDEFWDYDDSLTLLAPLHRNSPPHVAWRASVYREDVPISATWTPMPTYTVTLTESFAFVRDGTWDEFLGVWYTGPLTPTVGQWCHYIPPAQRPLADAEPLSLTVEALDETAVQLSWDATSDERAVAYWLFVQDPYDIAWVAQETLPLTQTSVTQGPLIPGESYHFGVAARDEEGTIVARSNEVTWTVPVAPQPMLLPLLMR